MERSSGLGELPGRRGEKERAGVRYNSGGAGEGGREEVRAGEEMAAAEVDGGIDVERRHE